MSSVSFSPANLDVAVSTRAAAATALSTAQWTNARAAFLDTLGSAGLLTSAGVAQTSGVNGSYSSYTQLVASLSGNMCTALVNISFQAGASAALAKNQVAIATGPGGSETDQFLIDAYIPAAPGVVTVPVAVEFRIASGTRVAFRSTTADATHASTIFCDFIAFG
jgi:hypothetical protein